MPSPRAMAALLGSSCDFSDFAGFDINAVLSPVERSFDRKVIRRCISARKIESSLGV